MAGKCRWPISMSRPSETGLKIKFTITVLYNISVPPGTLLKIKMAGIFRWYFDFGSAFGSVSQLV